MGKKELQEYVNHVAEILLENCAFIGDDAEMRNVADEIIELLNDVIDYGIVFAKEYPRELQMTSAMINYAEHILMPLSYGVYLDFLSANIPACLMQLRVMTEFLPMCLYADLKDPQQKFFLHKTFALERKLKERRTSISKIIRDSSAFVGEKTSNETLLLWRELSEYWVHPAGLMRRIFIDAVESRQIPAWAVAIPMGYIEEDKAIIMEFFKHLSLFRRLLRVF
jgi:hypothetical protein